ncbi:hypothetical protein AMJ82_12165, partial [candidate division TA06 bacterium SM23_40]
MSRVGCLNTCPASCVAQPATRIIATVPRIGSMCLMKPSLYAWRADGNEPRASIGMQLRISGNPVGTCLLSLS